MRLRNLVLFSHVDTVVITADTVLKAVGIYNFAFVPRIILKICKFDSLQGLLQVEIAAHQSIDKGLAPYVKFAFHEPNTRNCQ